MALMQEYFSKMEGGAPFLDELKLLEMAQLCGEDREAGKKALKEYMERQPDTAFPCLEEFIIKSSERNKIGEQAARISDMKRWKEKTEREARLKAEEEAKKVTTTTIKPSPPKGHLVTKNNPNYNAGKKETTDSSPDWLLIFGGSVLGIVIIFGTITLLKRRRL